MMCIISRYYYYILSTIRPLEHKKSSLIIFAGVMTGGIPISPTPVSTTPILPTPIPPTPVSPTLKFYLIPVSPTLLFCAIPCLLFMELR